MLVADIRRAVAAHYRLTDADLLGKSRQRMIARPRQVAMYLARELTGESFDGIGMAIGGRHHATVMHGVAEIAATRTRYARDIFAILGRLPE